jgi:hypothetical protein
MAAIHWQDVKGVHFLSTQCDPIQHGGLYVERAVGGKKVKVPTSSVQLAYALNMRGVDTQDHVRTQYTIQLSTKKWWHRLFFFGVDAAFANSYFMYKHMSLVGGIKPMDHYTFMLEVSHALMGIPLPSDYAKPVQREVHTCGFVGGNGQASECNPGNGVSREGGSVPTFSSTGTGNGGTAPVI